MLKEKLQWWVGAALCWGVASAAGTSMAFQPQEKTQVADDTSPVETQVATFGGGCFWCVEAVFERLDGVTDVVSGYAGGRVPNPSYEQVCTGLTGHAEVCQIHFDPSRISYEELLEVFFKTHDPTTLNRQGPDVGTQYRSIILYHDEAQKAAADAMIRKLNQSGAYPSRVVTEVRKFTRFYPAEPYHQDYFRNHPENRYCALVVQPKVEKAEKEFKEKLRKNP